MSQDPAFLELCMACRVGDLEKTDKLLSTGVNVNDVDEFDYTPLYLASLCGYEEVVKLLLQRGAVCDMDKYEGARCVYGALTDRIRNLLISFDISKAVDTNLPFASHIRALLKDDKMPTVTEDFMIGVGKQEHLKLHRFMLNSRSEYFRKLLNDEWKDKDVILFDENQEISEVLELIVEYLYLTIDLNKLDKVDHQSFIDLCKKYKLETYASGLEKYFAIFDLKKKAKLANQLQMDILMKARDDFNHLVGTNIIGSKLVVPASGSISSDQINSLKESSGAFPDTILSIKDEDSDVTAYYPVHRAILIRNEYFKVMFTSSFQEAQEYQIIKDFNIVDFKASSIPIIDLPLGSQEVAEIIIKFLYYDYADIPVDYAIDILYAGDLLLNERLKTMAAVAITTANTKFTNDELYEILRAGWETRIERLEHFVAKTFSDNLTHHLTDPKFHEIILESSQRILERQETDTIELVDDIRYYLAKKWKVDFEGLFEGEVSDDYDQSPGYKSYQQDLDEIEKLLNSLNLEA